MLEGFNMKKEWFVLIDGKQDGPYSLPELKKIPYVTPDTFVWKKGYPEWKQIRFIKELEEVFKDEPESVPTEDRINPKKPLSKIDPDQDVITLQRDPIQFFLWILFIILLIFYLYYLYYGN